MAEPTREIFGERDNDPSLRKEGAMLMGKGALIGAAIAFGATLFVWLFIVIGSILPPESKEAPDPSFGAIEAPHEPQAA